VSGVAEVYIHSCSHRLPAFGIKSGFWVSASWLALRELKSFSLWSPPGYQWVP